MYQGDDSFTFRSDRQGRGRNREVGRLRYDPPETAPAGYEREPVPAGRSAAEERIARLEATVLKLEGLVGQVEEVLAAVEQWRLAPPRMDRPYGDEQTIQMLEAHGDEELPAADSTGENLRVSLFADSGASAVLGQVRILE